MTVRELIRELESVDEDIKDYGVGFVFRVQINDSVRISGKSIGVIVPQNVDVDAKMFWLKARS